MKKVKVTDILTAPIGKQIELGALVFKGFLNPDKNVEDSLQQYNRGGYAKLDPTSKYATRVLIGRETMTKVVAHYVKTNAAVYTDMKPNL